MSRAWTLFESNLPTSAMDDVPVLRTNSTVEEHVESHPQTPSIASIDSLQHGNRQPLQYSERTNLETTDGDILQSGSSISRYPGKMLALPIPSVRAVDINIYREAGYMGMNPITLTGETGPLPGSWGDAKEFVNVMSYPDPWGQAKMQEPEKGPTDARKRPLGQQRPKIAIIGMHELHMQYAQAILDGNAFEESRVDTSPSLAMKKRWATVPAVKPRGIDEDENENEWVDVSDDDEDDRTKTIERTRKREDSGYSCGKAGLRTKEADEKTLLPKQRKTVRFDNEAIEKRQKVSEADRLLARCPRT